MMQPSFIGKATVTEGLSAQAMSTDQHLTQTYGHSCRPTSQQFLKLLPMILKIIRMLI